MNYRHAYHAGNFADVVKHLILVRIVEYLKRKDKPFRVIDTHAGIGLYDLSSDEAQKTGEWREGIGRLLTESLPEKAAALAEPYLAIVRGLNAEGSIRFYPGSPLIVRRLLRSRDRLTAIEKHPQDAVALRTQFEGDFQSRILELDGWLSLGAHVPPKEKRGLVLVDPPFEQGGEFERIIEGLMKAHRRWPGGIYAFWYPIKDRRALETFRHGLATCGVPRILDVTVTVRGPSAEPRLDGTGMMIVNPPYSLTDELGELMPSITALLANDDDAACHMNWLARETAADEP